MRGVMYLLYKKKDQTKIENHCPITLLNTDYKLYTKTIVNELLKVDTIYFEGTTKKIIFIKSSFTYILKHVYISLSMNYK